MGTESASTQEFQRGKVEDDSSCLYSSFLFVNGTDKTMTNQCLRSLVGNSIVKNKTLHTAVFERCTSCTTVEDYCEQIKKGKLRGGEPEVRTLSIYGHILIRQVTMTKNNHGKIHVTILNYGEEIESFKECVYILYDQETKHYDPLFVVNMQNPDEKQTIFGRDDTTISELLQKFIREELHDDGFIQLDTYIPSNESERQTETNLVIETDRLSDMILPTASTNLPSKRKLPDYASLTFASTPEIEFSLPISNNNNVSNKPAKIAKLDTYATSIREGSNSESMSVEPILQIDMFASNYVSEVMEQQLTTDTLVTLNQLQQGGTMRFEVEPAKGCRGRTQHEFTPKKSLNRKKQPASQKPPRYFLDQNNRRCLNLLIPEAILAAGLLCIRAEICIVTEEINGYTYYHPYFKLKLDSTNCESANVNPKYIYFDNTIELLAHSEGFRQLELPLVVVMHTNPELMKCEQPLKVFLSSTNNPNKTRITSQYKNYRALKTAYHLHNLRFAITLWTKQPGQEEYKRHDDIQYISQISKEDRKYKIPKK